MPNFKLIQHALVPVLGSWIDAVHLVVLFVFMALAVVFLRCGFGGGKVRRLVQLAAFAVFVVTIHRCLCMLRGAWRGFENVGRDDLTAFGDLCLALPVAAFTLAFGRVFCGWICPLGFVLSLLGKIAGLLQHKLSRRLEFLLWCAAAGVGLTATVRWLPSTFILSESAAMFWGWLAMLCAGAVILFPKLDDRLRKARTLWALAWVCVLGVGVFVTNPWCVAVGGELDFGSLTGLMVVILAGVFVSMAWCRYACPLGAVQGWLSPRAYLRFNRADACVPCGRCDEVCPTGALSPHGIQHSECIVCGRCERLCGYSYGSVIGRARERSFGSSATKVAALIAGFASIGAYGLYAWLPVHEPAADASRAGGRGDELAPADASWYTFAATFRRDAFADVRFPAGGLRRRWKVRPTDRVWRYQRRTGVWSSGAALARIGSRTLVFAGYYDHNLYAFDASNGRVCWHFTTGGVPTDAPTVTVLDGQTVVLFTSTDRTLYAVAGDSGRRLWAFESFPWKDTVEPSVGSSPIAVKVAGQTRVIFSMWHSDKDPLHLVQKGELIAVDPANPKHAAWRATLDTAPLSSPALAVGPEGPLVIVASLSGHVWGIDPASGARQWEFIAGAQLGGAPSVGAVRSVQLAPRPDESQMRTKVRTTNASRVRTATFFGDRFGLVYALDAASGELLWKRKVGHMVDATPTFVDAGSERVLLVASFDRSLHALDADTGKPRWHIPTGDYITATPCAVRLDAGFGVFFWSLDNQIYLAKLSDGSLAWQSRTDPFLWTHATRGETRFSSPCAGLDEEGRPIVVLPAYDGYLYCFGPDS